MHVGCYFFLTSSTKNKFIFSVMSFGASQLTDKIASLISQPSVCFSRNYDSDIVSIPTGILEDSLQSVMGSIFSLPVFIIFGSTDFIFKLMERCSGLMSPFAVTHLQLF